VQPAAAGRVEVDRVGLQPGADRGAVGRVVGVVDGIGVGDPQHHPVVAIGGVGQAQRGQLAPGQGHQVGVGP
jgi:hypothetical protein